MDFLIDMLNTFLANPEYWILSIVGLSVFIVIQGLSGMFAGESSTTRRMHATTIRQAHGADYDLLHGDDSDPHGLFKAFIPSSKQERSRIGKQLRRAGIRRKHAVRSFYAFRSFMGIILPALFIIVIALPLEIQLKLNIAELVQKVTWLNALQIVTGLMVLGFYAPALWLRSRIRKRRQQIEFSLPNALDLLQVAMEAGLGFDAAMTRVSHELSHAAPEISQEFMILQREVQAGKERQAALMDMA